MKQKNAVNKEKKHTVTTTTKQKPTTTIIRSIFFSLYIIRGQNEKKTFGQLGVKIFV